MALVLTEIVLRLIRDTIKCKGRNVESSRGERWSGGKDGKKAGGQMGMSEKGRASSQSESVHVRVSPSGEL